MTMCLVRIERIYLEGADVSIARTLFPKGRKLTVKGLNHSIEIEDETRSEQGGADGMFWIDTEFTAISITGIEQSFVHFI